MSTATVREAMEKLGANIRAQPEKARAKATSATARVTQLLKCEVNGPNGERLNTDMPPAMGGSASAPNPGWLLRAGLASAGDLRDLVKWADDHSPVGCTIRKSPACSLDIEVL
jgi:hypothetical protein